MKMNRKRKNYEIEENFKLMERREKNLSSLTNFLTPLRDPTRSVHDLIKIILNVKQLFFAIRHKLDFLSANWKVYIQFIHEANFEDVCLR